MLNNAEEFFKNNCKFLSQNCQFIFHNLFIFFSELRDIRIAWCKVAIAFKELKVRIVR